jgi:hypothetical protein
MAHRLRIHKWENGVLNTIDHFFNQFEQALDFATNNVDSGHIKIYDQNNQVLHSTDVAPTSTYA